MFILLKLFFVFEALCLLEKWCMTSHGISFKGLKQQVNKMTEPLHIINKSHISLMRLRNVGAPFVFEATCLLETLCITFRGISLNWLI